MKTDSATGPDLLPARILKECAKQLATPFRILAVLILQHGTWPQTWMEHWIVPLFKKGASFVPCNYRGIHLTPQISQAMERFLGSMIANLMCAPANIGANQFAYQRERKARDVLACIVLTQIHGFHDKLQFLLYCSGVSGAFELVKRERLLAQLWARECLRSLYEFSTHNYKSAKQKS